MGEDKQGKRRSGAPAGNQNARKHGFYSKMMTSLEAEDLEACLAEGLGDEIALLRVFCRRVFELAKGVKEPELAISYLRAFGMTAVDLAACMRVQQSLGGKKGTASEALAQALASVQQELKLNEH